MATTISKAQTSVIEMEQGCDDMLLTTSTNFVPATPSASSKPGSPSLPSSGMRRLNIRTPINKNECTAEDTESKALEEPPSETSVSAVDELLDPPKGEEQTPVTQQLHSDKDCLLRDDSDYITVPDHKQLRKLCESHPHKMYNRIQSRNLKKLDDFLQSKMTAFALKKKQKMMKMADSKPSSDPNPKSDELQTNVDGKGSEPLEPSKGCKSDKMEMNGDDDDDEVNDGQNGKDDGGPMSKSNDCNKTEEKEKEKEDDGQSGEFSTEHKIHFIEKALAASHQNLMHFNKLLFNPRQSANSTQSANRRQQQRLDSERKGMKTQKIQEMKRLIEEKRNEIMTQIETLKALRAEMQCIEVVIPQSVRDKMVRNIDYQDQNENEVAGLESVAKQERTKQILAMMNDNKKKEMIALKAKREELRENEIRLKARAEQVKSESEQLKAFIELKKLNRMALERERDDAMDVDQEEQRNVDGEDSHGGRNRAVSMASSVASTIHGSLSPDIHDKFKKRAARRNMSFSMLRVVHRDVCYY